MSWITALRSPQIAALIEERGPFQPSLFDERDLAALTAPAFPASGWWSAAIRLLAEERASKRADLLQATAAALAALADQIARAPARKARIRSACAWVA